MSGDPNTPHPPVAYSYDTTSNGETTGHTVTIAPGQLDASIKTFKEQASGQSPYALTQALHAALLTDGDFGKIPSSGVVADELDSFISDHVQVMSTMGDVLSDFVARVQAAAQLGYETDPETRRQLAWARAHER